MTSILRESIVLDRLLGVLYRRILIEEDWWFGGLWRHEPVAGEDVWIRS